MIKDAEKFAEEDKQRKELITVKNESEATIHLTEKAVSDLGDKASSDEKNNATEEIKKFKNSYSI